MDSRKIIHIDMDAFYASVEQRDFPQYRGKPVVVGGAADKRGVVATCSYEARRFGIHSAMPTARAYQLCPHAVFVAPRFDIYRQVSQRIRRIFHHYTQSVEPLSLDEAYLDVTDMARARGSATAIAEDIKARIRDATQLSASAGVSYNKFLAKLASDLQKPDGLTVIRPEQGPDFIARLPIGKFFGIGKATEARMKALGIHNGADLRNADLKLLVQHFGKAAAFYYDISRGIDTREVEPHRIRKSLSSETTFERDISSKTELQQALSSIATQLARDLNQRRLFGFTLTLKVKYHDFKQVTRSVSSERALVTDSELTLLACALLDKTDAGNKAVRLVGLGVSNFAHEQRTPPQQASLF